MYPGSHHNYAEYLHETLTISYLGSGGVGDDNKGHHLLDEIIEKINISHTNVNFNIHLGNAAVGGVDSNLLKLKEIIEQYENVSVFSGLLGCNQYCGLIENSNIVILPYGPRYQHIMSGIFDDCLFLGIPCVVPKQSKMALWLESHNIEFSSFTEWDAKGISIAVGDVISRYDYYHKQFQLARQICRNRWDKRNPFAVFGIPLKLSESIN